MQWKWNAWLQTPQATVQSSVAEEDCWAWHSMHKSRKNDVINQKTLYSPIMWLRQMAQLSTTISHAHRATAFHFLISKRFFSQVAGASTSIDAILKFFKLIFWTELFKSFSANLYSQLQNRLFRHFECRWALLFRRDCTHYDRNLGHYIGKKSSKHGVLEVPAPKLRLFWVMTS